MRFVDSGERGGMAFEAIAFEEDLVFVEFGIIGVCLAGGVGEGVVEAGALGEARMRSFL